MRMTVQPRADRGPTQCDFAQGRLGLCDPLNTELYLPGIAAEFLPEADRRGVLKVCAPDFYNLIELLRLALQRLIQSSQRRQQLLLHHFRRGDVNGRGNHVVARLAEIHMVVGMHELAAARPAEQLRRAVRDHLVRVHIGGRAGPRLKNIHRKFRIQFAVDHFGRRQFDRLGRLFVQQAKGVIHRRGGPLDHPHGPNHSPWHAQRTDREILDRARGLHSVVRLNGDSQLPHGILLNPSRCRRLVLILFHAQCSMCKRFRLLAGVMINSAPSLSQEQNTMTSRQLAKGPLSLIHRVPVAVRSAPATVSACPENTSDGGLWELVRQEVAYRQMQKPACGRRAFMKTGESNDPFQPLILGKKPARKKPLSDHQVRVTSPLTPLDTFVSG
ncbi:hypothetical protein COMA2_10033 [Candidatus Nitrospira nitrificans]|uniref:Uncharacterized protein n=1 Tax=Candidatus Nitrospira nitrificans TaxID=1742973 RepID=A0A0S4L616_9BACT|nr:hypothetical protein COMA2_10033 [Candidatus Nitrospira nitrificans]